MCIASDITEKGLNPAKMGPGFIGSFIVLDNNDQLVQRGVAGELLIGGPLAREYLKNPEKTKASFVPTPSCIPAEMTRWKRWYRTGDLVKMDFDGSIIYISRKDEVSDISHLSRNYSSWTSLESCSFQPELITPRDIVQLEHSSRFTLVKDTPYQAEVFRNSAHSW